MKRLIYLLLLFIFTFSAMHAENVKVVIPTNKQAIVPSDSKKNRVLNSQPLVSDNKPGRFELYTTDNIWEWLLFDTETGEMWILKWSAKQNILSKLSIVEKQDVE